MSVNRNLWLFGAFLVLIILLMMFNNLEHIAQVYHALVKGTSHNSLYEWIESYSVVITFDLIVIALLYSGKVSQSLIVAWIIFVMNMIFFNAIYKAWLIYESAVANVVYQKLLIEHINSFIATTVFSGMFAWGIHKIPMIFKEHIAGKSTLDKINTENSNLKNDIISISESNSFLFNEIKALKELSRAESEHNKALKEQVEFYKKHNDELHEGNVILGSQIIAFQNLFTCEYCNTFQVDLLEKGLERSIKALRAHAGVCKKHVQSIN